MTLLIVGGEVVTMNAAGQVALDATIAVVDGLIAAIGPATELRAAYPGATELDASGCVVIPGMVNAHQHTTTSPLVRSSTPDDIAGVDSIFKWSVPLHEQVTEDDDEMSATMNAVEMLTLGVTTVIEAGTVAYPDRVAKGLATAGIRARVSGWGSDVMGGRFGSSLEQTLARQEEILLSLPRAGLVTGGLSLVGHGLASDELFIGVAQLAEKYDTHMTWHMSPGPEDAVTYLARTGTRPVLHLNDLGVLGPRLLLAHAVWLDDAEIDILAETGTAVASCPGAYLRLAQQYVRAGRHLDFIRRGGRLAIGCDAHNAGDVPDVLRSAWLLAALERDRDSGDQLEAHEAFGLATIDGARAVGLGELVGSIEVGKAADLVLLDTRDLAWMPRGDLAMQLIWGCPSHSVRDVIVNGNVVIRERKVLTIDVDALAQEVAQRSVALLRRAGIDPPHRWTSVTAAEYVRGESV
jgi:5-methylthioadenosine/S-adenosylhomocysteine deaminase